MKITIAVVDDQTLLRDGLAAVINGFDNCEVTIRASNGEDLIRQMAVNPLPNLIILDYAMPVMDGKMTATWLKDNHPSIPVLSLTMYNSDFVLIQLVKLGVRGFLKKDILPAELHEAIKSTVETGYYFSGSTTVKLVKNMQQGSGDAPNNSNYLSDKEIEFLQLASTELTYKQISDKMGISARTVDNYRDILFNKLEVESRIGLVLFAIRNGIVNVHY